MQKKGLDDTTKIILGVAAVILGTFVIYKIRNRTGGKKGSGKSFRKKLVDIAEKEHSTWNFGRLKEGASSMYNKLVDYWNNIGWSESRWSPTGTAWSAAFISYVMKKANAGNNFKYSSSHSSYIRDAVKNRKQNNSNPFKAYKLNEKKVEVGDLVCYSRQGGVDYDTTSSYKSHCDIVVSANKNEAKVIGGNVNHTVGKKSVKLNNGYVNDSAKDWFTIIKTT